MILVRPDDVGPAAFARLLRDRHLAHLLPGVARPADIPDSPGLRALAAADRVPTHVVLTGLAALWVHCWRDDAPAGWHAVGVRGLYRPASTAVRLHSGPTARLGATVEGGLRLAPPARACVDALRWEPPHAALHTVAGAVARGRLAPADLEAALRHDARSSAGYARVAGLVEAIRAAWSP
ncbi:hypothetical protein [Demequina phytophila]|uniref:hypothetical protein n=1 Tax=Demequina phytophila TaxID=1638981 RepID=UPI000AC2F1A9|nr:hypothetical protein [Demequina phytophila]